MSNFPYVSWSINPKPIPRSYDDGFSQYESIEKLIELINSMIDGLNNNTTDFSKFSADINTLKDSMESSLGEIDKLKNGDYISSYLGALSQWIDNNLQSLISKSVDFVTFGIDDNGNFIASIPQKWDFLTFDTILDTNDNNYGHLILNY